MPQITKSQIIYDEKDWLAGLHPQYGSRTIPQKFGKFARFQIAFNPFINLGYAQNSYLNTDFANKSSVTSRILNVAIDGQSSYGIDSAALLHKLAILPPSVVITGGFPHTISAHGGHSGVAGSDVCIYYHNVSSVRTKSLFYSWNDNTDGDIGIFDLSSTFDDDFMSTVPTSGAVLTKGTNHPMEVGYDDILYIGNGRYLNAYDGNLGANGTYFPAVLTLPEGYEIVSMSKLQPRSFVIFAYNKNTTGTIYRSDSKAFFWDYLSLDPYQIENLSDNVVTESFEYNGTVGCFTNGRGNYSKLKIYNGSEFETIAKYLGYGPYHGGCDVNENEIYFNTKDGQDGIIYCYGNNDGIKNTLNALHKIDSDKDYSPGFFKILSNFSYAGSQGKDNASSAVIQYLDHTKYATEGLWYSDLTDIGYERIQITGITVYFADEFTGGRDFTFSLLDRFGNYAISGLTNLATVTTTNRIYKAKPINYSGSKPIPPLDGVGIELFWGSGTGSSVTPIINKVVLDYTPVTIN